MWWTSLSSPYSIYVKIMSRLKLGNVWSRIFSLPVHYKKIWRLRYKELQLCPFFCFVVKLGLSQWGWSKWEKDVEKDIWAWEGWSKHGEKKVIKWGDLWSSLFTNCHLGNEIKKNEKGWVHIAHMGHTRGTNGFWRENLGDRVHL